MRRIAIYGASGFGREVLPLVKSQYASQVGAENIVFVDDKPATSSINGVDVLSYDHWLKLPANNRQIVIAIANGETRQSLVSKCVADNVSFLSVRAANVVELDDVKVGDGSILCSFVCLTSNISIGHHFHANIYSYIAHDCLIGNYVTFAPGVKCNGNIVIEDYVYVGTGAILKQGRPGNPLIIGKGAVIGMGAVVTKNVAPGVTVVGNPANLLVKD